MKKVLLLVLMFTSVFVLTACNKDEAAEGKIEIIYWHQSPVASDSFSATKNLITEFNESQDVYYVRGIGINFWDYWDKINIAIASKTAPDIGLHTIDNVQLRASGGVLHNLSDLIAGDVAAGIDELDMTVFYENQIKYTTYDGSLYALPFSANTRVLYYNLDMFEAAGLTEADVPTTWEELGEIAPLLNITDGDEIVQIGFDPTYGQGTYMGYLWQAGLDFFDENQQPTLNTQKHIDILDWMVSFNDDTFTRTQRNAFGEANQMLGIDPFAAGRVAMMISTDALYETMETYGSTINYGVSMIPVPEDGGIRVSWGSGFSLELFDNGDDDPVKLEGAWQFMKFIMSKDTQIALADALGWIMGNKDAMEVVVAGNPIKMKLLEEVQYATDKVYIDYAPNWHAADWQTYYDEVLEGTMTPAETLAAARANYLQKQENYEDIN